mgnify:CR=1 FL=1
MQKITIISYFSNEPTESIYKIEKVSKLQNNEYYRITCLASNYAEVIIDLNTKGRWIKRKISHNGIYHKYYNYAVASSNTLGSYNAYPEPGRIIFFGIKNFF